MTRSHTQQRGLSLIELMVAITLTLLLALGLTQVFIASKQGYRVQESSSRLQDNARVAIEVISRNIRMADFWGGVKTGAISGTGSATATGTCTSAWIVDAADALHGYPGDTTPPLCISAQNYVADTDVLLVRYANADGITKDADIDTSKRDLFVRVAAGRSGYLFNLSGGSKVWSDAQTAIPAGDGVMNYPYVTAILYVRPCSAPAGATCASTDDGGTPIPTLVSQDLPSSATLPELKIEPQVENIEQLRFEYGVDGDGDGLVDRYYPADSVPSWPEVIAVRFGIIVRGDTVDGFTDSSSYDMPGGYTYTPAENVRRYQRRLFIKDVQVRNRIRG
ncbi:MAG: PilW family protein [Solimonas sp.]